MNIAERLKKIHAELGDGKWQEIVKPYMQPKLSMATWQIANTFGPFLGIWILMYFSTQWTLLITFPLAIINGFFLVRIFVIQHDCGHQSFFGFKNKNANNALGIVCSMFSTIPYKYRARAHHFHHAHNGELEVRDIGDINFWTVEEYLSKSRIKRMGYKVFRSPIVLFFFAPIIYFLFSNRAPFLTFKGMKKSIKWSQLRNNILLAGLYVSLAMLVGWEKFLLVHGSIVITFFIIAFWFFYVQHQHEESYKQRKENRDFLSSSIIGSTYYKLPKLFQWLTGNIGIHHIHHLSSAIPNYNLQRCIDDNFVLNKYVTTINFSQSLDCVKNKLWDEKQQKMITWDAFKRSYGSQQ